MAEQKPREAYRRYPGLKVGEQGRWSLRKGRVMKADSGGHGARFLGRSRCARAVTAGLFFPLQSLALPAAHVFSISSRRGDKSVCGSTLFCGKNDPMLWRWSLSTSHSQIQIRAHAAHQFACQASKMGFLLLKVSHLSRWV